MGLGSPAQTLGTLSPDEIEVISTIPDTLVKSNVTQQNMTGIFIMPLATNTSGRIDWGGINPGDGLASNVSFVPNTKAPGFKQL